MAINYGLIVRLVSYGIMIPGAVMLGLYFHNLGSRRRAALMVLYALAHTIALTTVVLRLLGLVHLVVPVAFALTPIVLAQAVLFGWISASIVRGTIRDKKSKADEVHTWQTEGDE